MLALNMRKKLLQNHHNALIGSPSVAQPVEIPSGLEPFMASVARVVLQPDAFQDGGASSPRRAEAPQRGQSGRKEKTKNKSDEDPHKGLSDWDRLQRSAMSNRELLLELTIYKQMDQVFNRAAREFKVN